MSDEREVPRERRSEGSWILPVVCGLLWLPLLRSVVGFTRTRSAPLYDTALFEMHVRDVGTRHSPLLGLAGRLSTLPDVGSHPGPLAFYVLAPPYRLLGSSFWALRVSVSISAATAILTSLLIARRRAGTLGVIAVGIVLAVLELGFGRLTFTDPWNPYVPVPWFVAFLLAIWSVLAGEVKFLPAAAAIASFCVQTHISYLPVCGGLSAIAFLVVLTRWRRAVGAGFSGRDLARLCASTVAIVVLLWVPPLLEECVHARGNMTILLHHFRHPPEPVTGFGKGTSLFLQHLDVWSFATRAFRSPGVFRDTLIEPTSAVLGAVLLLAWLASASVAWRLDRTLVPLYTSVAATLALTLIAASRIVGIPYAHVLFFARCAGGFALISVLLTVGDRLRGSFPPRALQWVRLAGILGPLVCVLRLMTERNDGGSQPSHPGLQLSALARSTVQSLLARDRTSGQAGQYLITWHDAFHGGAQGYGLLMELERSGIHAFVADNGFNRALVGSHRVLDPKKATATLDIVNGAWIGELAGKPGTVMLAFSDPRTPSDRETYAWIVNFLGERLRKLGKPELVPQIERNFYALGASGLSPGDILLTGQLVRIGAPGAVLLCSKP